MPSRSAASASIGREHGVFAAGRPAGRMIVEDHHVGRARRDGFAEDIARGRTLLSSAPVEMIRVASSRYLVSSRTMPNCSTGAAPNCGTSQFASSRGVVNCRRVSASGITVRRPSSTEAQHLRGSRHSDPRDLAQVHLGQLQQPARAATAGHQQSSPGRARSSSGSRAPARARAVRCRQGRRRRHASASRAADRQVRPVSEVLPK